MMICMEEGISSEKNLADGRGVKKKKSSLQMASVISLKELARLWAKREEMGDMSDMLNYGKQERKDFWVIIIKEVKMLILPLIVDQMHLSYNPGYFLSPYCH